MGIDYKDSGVDIVAGDALVDWLQDQNSSGTRNNKTPIIEGLQKKLLSGIGGFASIFKMDFPEIKKPCLVSSTDGVGTKVKLASYYEDYSTVGQDLVAMCVNDLLCTGARPLFFLDYYATSKLKLNAAKEFLSGVKRACELAECLLVGGETAEMPGVYHDNDFDCAGFVVGIVDEEKILNPSKVQVGDVLIGIESSGFHSNGYSLLRKIYEQDLNSVRSILMKPTHIYVDVFHALNKSFDIHGCAHITGSGIQNIPRMLPKNMKAQVRLWEIPECFLDVQKKANLNTEKLLETFNCGVGLVICLSEGQVDSALSMIQKFGYKSFRIGKISAHQGEPMVEIQG